MFKKTHKARYIRVVLKARTWKRAPMKLLKWKKKMTAKKQEYDLVTNDEYDTRIPLHPDEAFSYGITFEAKYIGTMDVPRPMSRVEIVAAMRRVRYEFKARGVKKRKVTVDVSIDGVRITTRSKTAGKRKTSTKFFGRKTSNTAEGSELMHHPIYRIFYVSHDSSDLKIFSYIARDGATNVFKCNVFKSNRKSQAMRIVRTVGQAFEVCHKMQVNSPEQPAPSTSSAGDEVAPTVSDNAASKEVASECSGSEVAATTQVIVEEAASRKDDQTRPSHLDLLPPPPRKEGKRSIQRTIPPPSISLSELPECVTKVDVPAETTEASTPLSAQHQLQLLKERLDQQAQQTRAAVAQLLLLRDQLAAEQAARCEAQARTHQLLVHNKELLEHIAALVAHLQDRERGTVRPISAQQLTLLPQMADNGVNNANKMDHFAVGKGIRASVSSDALIDLFAHPTTAQQNIENNNNSRLSPYNVSPAPEMVNGITSAPCFGGMSNEEIQNYLISKFQDMGGFAEDISPKKFNGNQQFYQNSNAFPNIPPLTNHYSAADLASLLDHSAYAEPRAVGGETVSVAQAMSVGQSENSLFSPSRESSSKDSTPDEESSDEGGIPFIMPLSHNGTLTATGSDGRVRLIVPVSPSESVAEVRAPVPAHNPPAPAHHTPAPALLAVPAAPITRTTSEKVPNRSEMMTALRSQWTRHTTK